jgi:antirestriction protein ArdC
MATQEEIRARVTDKIIAALANGGCPPWRRPWAGGVAQLPTNIVSRKRYSGINVPLLELAAMDRGFTSPWWGTFRQWDAVGGKVMKRPHDVAPGQWGTHIVFCKPVTRVKKTDDGEEQENQFFLLREYVVFNAEQVEGIDGAKYESQPRTATGFADYGPAEEVVVATGAHISHGGSRAFYRRDTDHIQLPPKESFTSAVDYYPVVFHELVHWTESRLAWKGSYALGELVAEIGGCYLTAEVGIPQSDDMTNHASYVESWLRELKEDNRAIFRAASQASKAADFILSFSRKGEAEHSEESEEAVVSYSGR